MCNAEDLELKGLKLDLIDLVRDLTGSEDARYSNSRSVSYIAKQIKLDSNYYNSLSTTNKNIIDRFAR